MKNRTKNRNRSLTEGPILPSLLALALPIMASTCFSTAYNITDMIWIGRLGSRSVAAVGAAGMYLWFSHGFSVLARMGGQVLTAHSLGRKNEDEAAFFGAASLKLAALFALIFACVCQLFAFPMVKMFGLSDPDTIREAVRYLRITGGLTVFPFVNQVLTGLFTAHGDSKTPLMANTLGLITNMVLDPLLVLGAFGFPRWEESGAAVATVCAQMISTAAFAAALARRKEDIRFLSSLGKKIPRDYYLNIMKIGLPSGLQTCLYSFFSMGLTRMVAGFGEGAVAVQRVGAQIESLTWNAADGFGAASNAFAGQNYGAGRPDRIRKGYRVSALAVGMWGLLITLVFRIFPFQISRLFFFEPDVLNISVRYLLIVGLSEAFMDVEIVAGETISGMGKTNVTSLISILLTGLRIPLAMFLKSTSLGLDGIWWTFTLTSMAKGIALHIAFLAVCGKMKKDYSSQPSVKR